MTCRFLLAAAVLAVLPASTVAAQPAGAPLDLAALQAAAVARDPRTREIDLQAEASGFRLANIEAERLPSVSVQGRLQHQSDVPHAPFTLPSGEPLFSPAKDTVDATVRIDAPLVDPTREPRLAVERASRDEAQAQVRTALYGIRQEVNAAFFSAALLDERRRALETAVDDLNARLEETNARVREGAALPADAAGIEAAIIERREDLDEVAASRRAAVARLEELTGETVPEGARLPMPDLASQVAEARSDLGAVRARPEYDQFAKTEELLSRRQDAAASADRPRLSGFTTGGYGRPGLNFVDNRYEGYWLAGVQLQWAAWDRGTSAREREALTRQQAIVGAEQAAFTDRLRRSIEDALASIDRLSAARALDGRLVTLREQVAQTAMVQLQEGALTSAAYVDRNTDLLNARLTTARHRVEFAQASAQLLTMLGLEVR
jgi:outer membrane protein TolC